MNARLKACQSWLTAWLQDGKRFLLGHTVNCKTSHHAVQWAYIAGCIILSLLPIQLSSTGASNIALPAYHWPLAMKHFQRRN